MPPKIVLIGDFMVDEYIYCDANRLSPEAPVPVAEFRKRELKPGGAGNLLANLLSMEVPIDTVVGAWGNGCYGQVLHDLAVRVPNFLHLANETGKTTVKQRIIGQGRHLLRVDYYDQTSLVWDDWVEKEVVDAVKGAEYVILSDYGKGIITRDSYESMLTGSESAKIMIDPHPDHAALYRKRWLIKANEKEEERISLSEGFEYLVKTPYFVTTKGRNGASIRYGQDPQEHFSQQNPVIYGDPTGAGDVFMAAMIKAITDGHRVSSAVKIANLVAAESVKTFGTVVMGVDVYRKAEGEVCSG